MGSAHAQATDYRPPLGFNGHAWGTPLTSLTGLQLWRADAALGSTGKVTDFQLTCKQNTSPGETCSSVTAEIDQQIEGDGSFALGEYYFTLDQNPWHAQNIDIRAVTYLFCAFAAGRYLPSPLKSSLKLCGARVMFQSDTEQALAEHGADYQSNYDRILARLVDEFGPPPGYERRAEIAVVSVDSSGSSTEKALPPKARYRWCGLDDGDKHLTPSCNATVTLVFEASTGQGTILFATNPVYEYAYARHVTSDENNELYVLLEAPSPDYRYHKIKGDVHRQPHLPAVEGSDVGAPAARVPALNDCHPGPAPGKEEYDMSKGMERKKDTKKKPAKTLQEKRQAKKEKKAGKGSFL